MNDCPMTPELLRWIASTVDDATAKKLRALADWLANDRRRRRDLFAAAALTGYCIKGDWPDTIPIAAWRAADEMLAAEPPMPEVER